MKVYDQDIIIEQIVAFLDGRANRDEVSSLQIWVAQSEQHWTFFTQIKNIYEMSARKLAPSIIRTDKAMQKVLHRITLGERWLPRKKKHSGQANGYKGLAAKKNEKMDFIININFIVL